MLHTSQYILIGVAVLIAATVQTASGFGFSLLAVPVMSLMVPTELAVVIAATLGTTTSTGQAISERAHADRPTVKRLLLSAMFGLPLGLVILDVATSRELKFVLALVIFTFIVVDLRGVTLERASTPVDIVAGFIAGVLTTSLSTNGPPLAMALHARRLDPKVFRGTIATVLSVAGVISLVMFAFTGHFSVDAGIAIAIAIPSMVLGFFVGHRLRPRLDPPRFRRMVTILLLITGVVTTVSVITG